MCTTFLKSWNWFMHTMRPPTRSRPQPSPATPTRSSHSSSRAKIVHLVISILPSCNYCVNPAHKSNECNIFFEVLFCDYYGKERHRKAICFAKFSIHENFISAFSCALYIYMCVHFFLVD